MIRIADVRFLADVPARRVMVLGELADWRPALTAASVDVVEEAPDLVIAERRHARRAASLGAQTVIVLGSAPMILRRRGYRTRAMVVRKGGAGAGLRLVVPADAAAAVRHALLARVPGRSGRKRVATRALVAAVRRGIPLPGTITVGTKTGGQPLTLARAEEVGVAPTGDWCLLTGDGDDLQRLVWLCFTNRRESPEYAVKSTRVPGNDEPFAREVDALGSLTSLPPGIRRHAPHLHGRLVVDGMPATVETAAPGQPLHVLLAAEERPHASSLVERVADWAVDLAEATCLPPPDLAPELRRLHEQVVPEWVDAGAPRGLVAMLPQLSGCLQHNDLGPWNILVDGPSFTVVDWESSVRCGLPLWDLVYFLSDALTARPGVASNDERLERILALLRGQDRASAAMFTRLRNASETLRVPADAVGAIVTLGWLHHGLSATRRAQRAARHGVASGAASAAGPLQQIAKPWLSDPSLGVRWPAFAGET